MSIFLSDCTEALPQCLTLEYGGSPPVCRCKQNTCINADISIPGPSYQIHGVLQETTGKQRCKSCFIF